MGKLVFLLFLSLFIFSVTQNIYAQTADVSTASAKIEYDLAFPGILPDHPLYKLKVLRNKITVFLINNPSKKIDFYLLEADKGILATAMLVDKNRIKLAEETLLKAEHNLTLITYELKGGFYQKPKPEVFKKLKLASSKHQEVISSLIERVPKGNKKTFETVLEFSKRNLETIETLQKKKYYKPS